jgi:chromosome segregation and condensation protein ScpB
MLKGILFQKRGKIFACIFITLIVFLWLGISGINFAQSSSPEEVEKMKSIQIINPHPPFSLRLRLDKEREATYAPGEKIKISFQASQDSFVTLYNYDTEGRVKIIFPNQYSPHNFVRAGEVNSVEGLIDPHTRPGIEYVQGFATTRPILIGDKEKNLISKKFMPEVNKDFKNFTITIKGIVVSLPPNAWTSSNILSYTVRPITPPPTYYGRIIATSQPQGAKVYLDNVYRGTTPLNLDRVATGQHLVKLVMAGYQDWSSYVSVSPSRTTTVSADLIPFPAYGSISISCNQSSARIYLDGTYKKKTYSSRAVVLEDVEKGYHELLITKTGYKDWSKKIYVSPSKTTKVVVNLIKQAVDGSISIYCNQGNAKIYLDGSYKKRTSANKSVEIQKVREGYHELLITKDGYQDWISTIMVAANQTYMISAYLVSEINYDGSIAVYCNVSGAKIFVNGTYKAATSSSQPKILEEFKEKEYEITLIKDGHRTWVEDIWVYAGETTSIYVEMIEIEY